MVKTGISIFAPNIGEELTCGQKGEIRCLLPRLERSITGEWSGKTDDALSRERKKALIKE